MKYRFEQIAYNSTVKKIPTDADKRYYIGLEHIDSGSFEITRWGSDVAPIGEKLLMKKGDVLFGKRRAYQRKLAIAPFDGIFSAHGMVLRPKEDVIAKEFFPFFLSSDEFMEKAVQISVGGLSPTINWKDLREQVFELPTLSEQKRLAEKLWAAYRVKESYKKLFVTIDEIVKSQFIEMFSNKGYPKQTLNSFAEITTGSTPSKKEPKYWENGEKPWVSAQDMKDKYVFSTEEKLSDTGFAKCKILPIDTLMYVCRGSIGVMAINKIVCATNQSICTATCDASKCNVEFLYHSLLYQKERVKSIGEGTSFKSLSQSTFANIAIDLPPIEEQMKFVTIAEQADKSKFELKKSIEKIDNVIKALMQ